MEVKEQNSLNISDNNSEVVVDLSLYSLDSIKKACYKFTAKCSISLEKYSLDKLRVIFSFQPDTPNDLKDRIINDFNNELLDQNLREIVAKETEPVRNLILAHAFSRTSLIEQE